MSRRGLALAEAAQSFLGVAFRLYGRDPATGLDCVGLITVSLQAIGERPECPKGYRLRNSSIDAWLTAASRSGLTSVKSPISAGDILLVRPGPQQHHLLIAESQSSAIHAHAGLGRVVREPLDQNPSLEEIWRLID